LIDRTTTPNATKVCAVVVTYNRKALLEKCLKALLNQTRPLDEIIVVDNASTDGTNDFVKEHFPSISYIRQAENMGGAGGFHEGMKVAYEKGHDWIWVMDDDAIPTADALEKLTSFPLINEHNVYSLASAVLKQDGSISIVHRRLFHKKEMKEEVIGVDKYDESCFETDTASFVGLLVSRKAIKEVGLPIAEFFIYNDDVEYSLRIREKGIILTVPSSRIIHLQNWEDSKKSQLRQSALSWKDYYAIRNSFYVRLKYGKPGPKYYANVLLLTVFSILTILIFRRSRYESIKVVVRGTLDGLHGKLGRNRDFLPPRPN